MRGARSIAVVGIAALALGACTGQTATPPPAPVELRPGEVLLLGAGGEQLGVEASSGSLLFEAPGALASADRSTVFRTITGAGSTVVEAIDVASGAVVSRTSLDGRWEGWVASGTGDAMVLMEPLPPGWDREVPVPRSRSVLVVVDPTGAAEPMRFELEGNYEPEAFSVDGSRLFLLQHLPAETPNAYRVRMLDLERGKVRPVFGPFKSPPERMPGTRLQQELGPDGARLYTLYTSAKPGYAPHGAPAPEHAAVSFVHVLDLRDGWAHCAGLPRAFWDRPASAQAMAVSSDGARLYVVDAELGRIVVMDAETFETRTARLPIGVESPQGTSARLSADDRVLYVATAGGDGGLWAIDTGTLAVADRWDVGPATALALSGDGRRLYVALDGRVAVLDRVTGAEVGEVPFASPAPVVDMSVIGA